VGRGAANAAPKTNNHLPVEFPKVTVPNTDRRLTVSSALPYP
jgi:hypothetical protein